MTTLRDGIDEIYATTSRLIPREGITCCASALLLVEEEIARFVMRTTQPGTVQASAWATTQSKGLWRNPY